MFNIKEPHQINDFKKIIPEDRTNDTVYLSYKKIDSGEQKRVWGGIFKKVFMSTGGDYGPRKQYAFKGPSGDFVLGSSKLVDDAMRPFRIGDYARIEYRGRRETATVNPETGKPFKYPVFDISHSPSHSLRPKEVDLLLKEVEEEKTRYGFKDSLPQPLPSYLSDSSVAGPSLTAGKGSNDEDFPY